MMDAEGFRRLESKIDRLDERLDSIDVTLARQNEQLTIHIKRTELLEAAVLPLKSSADMTKGALKFIGLVGVVVAIILGVMQLIKGL